MEIIVFTFKKSFFCFYFHFSIYSKKIFKKNLETCFLKNIFSKQKKKIIKRNDHKILEKANKIIIFIRFDVFRF